MYENEQRGDKLLRIKTSGHDDSNSDQSESDWHRV